MRSSLVSLKLHLGRFAPHTGVQLPNTNTLQHWLGQNSVPTVHCCSAKMADSSLVSLKLHLGRFAPHTPIPMHCSTGQGKTASPLFSATLQKWLTAALCRLSYTLGDLLLIQVCSYPIPIDCSTGQNKTASPLFTAALQNRLTACLRHCKYTYGGLLLTQVCSDATPMHCSTGQGKIASPLFSAAL